MNISIISQNGHRINEYIADMVEKALEQSKHTTIRQYDDSVDLIIITNGVGITEEAMVAYKSDKPIIYLHDELRSSLIPRKDILVLSQYHNHGNEYFEVARLSIFDKRWEVNQQITKLYNFVYWGHQKEGREDFYSNLPDNDKCLYIGEWDKLKPSSHHAPYIRDRDTLLNMIGTGTITYIEGSSYDEKYNNQPLRIYEALMMRVTPIVSSIKIKHITYEEAYDYWIGNIHEERRKITNTLERIIDEFCG